VIHLLLESAAKGKIKDAHLREACESKWRELLAKHEETLSQDSRTAWMVPLESTAFRFAEKLERSLGKAMELAKLNASSATASETPGTPSWSAEQWLETKDKLVGGKVDLITRGPDGTAIKDYKSGAIYEDHKGTIKENYSLQLKLYAAIYHDAHGDWPNLLELIPLSGKPERVPFTPDECVALLKAAKDELARVNSLVESAKIRDAALPRPDCCWYCGFRPVCGKYRDAMQLPAPGPWPNDVIGTIVSVLEEQARLVFSVRMRETTVRVGFTGCDHSVSATRKAGERFAAFNLAKRANRDFEVWKGTVVFT
jgi:hypothetical protein